MSKFWCCDKCGSKVAVVENYNDNNNGTTIVRLKVSAKNYNKFDLHLCIDCFKEFFKCIPDKRLDALTNIPRNHKTRIMPKTAWRKRNE